MIHLRPHQIDAAHALYAALRVHRRVLFSLSTGGGKRFLAVWLCEQAAQMGRRVLFVTNRRLLVEQMFEHVESEGIPHAVIMADSFSGDCHAPIQIASLQTLESRYYGKGFGGLAGEGLPPAQLCIIDEAHRQPESYVQLWGYYPNAKVVGLTATPVGAQGKSLIPPYDTLLEGVKNSQLIRDGLLLPTKVYAPSEPDIVGVKIVNREEYSQRGLSRRVQEVTCFADVKKEWLPHEHRQTACFVPGVAFANGIADEFNKLLGAGRAYCITAKTKPDERKRAFEGFKDGSVKVLVSVDVLKEGWDAPICSCGIDLQPNAQLRTYWQKVGRVKRAHEGQVNAVWIDMAGNYWRHPHPDDDPDWSVSGEETTAEKWERKARDEKPSLCPACGQVRRGRVCECGHEASGPPIRRIRMGHGKLKQITHREKVKREKTELERKLDKWKGTLFMALRSGKVTFDGARYIHQKTHGEWPDQNLPFVAEPGSTWGKQRVADALTPGTLMRKCGEFLQGRKS